MYGKVENGVLTLAPKVLKTNGKVCYNPTEEQLIELGFLPVETTPYPADGSSYTERWQEEGGKITSVWEFVPPEPVPMTAEDRLALAEAEIKELKAVVAALGGKEDDLAGVDS